MGTQRHSKPKVHNAAWPGVVGKGEGSEPPIGLMEMLDLTAAAEVGGQRFDGIDLNYWKETLKRIELGLRKVRKMEAYMEPLTGKYGANFANSAW